MKLYECPLTNKINCPHKKIDGKLCFDCEIPDEPECKNNGDKELCTK